MVGRGLLFSFFMTLSFGNVLCEEPPQDLYLEAFVEGVQPLYPGQKATLIYRIYFKRDADILRQELPLLGAEGLLKVGELEEFISRKGAWTIQEVRQRVEAIEEGLFSFGPSIIEIDVLEEADESQKRQVSQVPPIEIEVIPFPKEGQPESFSGALGQFSMEVVLLSPSEVLVGDNVEIEFSFHGEGEWETVRLPDIGEISAFTKLFQVSDLPPLEKRGDKGKKIVVILRPRSSYVQEIPSFLFSFFDPQSRRYSILRSDPIPLAIDSLPDQGEDHKSDLFALENDRLQDEEGGEEAYFLYLKGVGGGTIYQREEAFNTALKSYFFLEREQGIIEAGLYRNIANCFHQLREYGWAIYYYQKALYSSSDRLSEEYLLLAQERASIAPEVPSSFSFLTLLFGSLEGMIISPSCLYAESGNQDSLMRKFPLLSGEKVEILEAKKEKKWLLVKTAEGVQGYLPSRVLRIL